MSTALDEFIADARAVSIEDAAKILGLKCRPRGNEHPQPCPQCGGHDRFSFNTEKKVWNCRHGGVGGHDAIGMVAHCLDYDIRRRDGFLEVCSILTGRPIPDGGERESDEDRAAREKRLEEASKRAAADAAASAAAAQSFREREREKARGIVERAAPLHTSSLPFGRFYLQRRGCGIPKRYIRVAADAPYWHGRDARGKPFELYNGPAMIAPFVDTSRELIGCHITWIDLNRPPKLRPTLFGLTDKGSKAGLPPWRYGDAWPSAAEFAASLYEPLPTKKMRGTKKGGLIPLAGSCRAKRWAGGEGIENGLAFARWEGFRLDTFYFAAGDLGNLAGPADPASRFQHPTLVKPDARGFMRPVMVQGAVPRHTRDEDKPDCLPVADHVDELVLLGDGDSEPVWTAACMARARKRHARHGRSIFIFWPRRGYDFSGMAVDYDDRRENAF